MIASDTWKTADELANDPHGLHTYWQNLPFDAIEAVASACRKGLVCRANRSKYAAGVRNIALELVFNDGTVWIARLTVNPDPQYKDSPESLAELMTDEIATLRLVAEKTIIPVPTVFAYSETQDNPVGFPYMLMSALTGHHPKDIGLEFTSSERPISEEKLPLFETFCASLAEIFVQLGWITFPTTGSICLDDNGEPVVRADGERCATSEEYWRAWLTSLEHRARLTEHPDRVFGLWLVWQLIRKNNGEDNGPFGLVHRKLTMENILVDKDGEITGIFGWSTAACLPRDFCVMQMSEFLAPSAMHEPDPERQSWALTFNRALEDVAPALAKRHGSGSASLIALALGFLPEGYTHPEFLRRMCMIVWKRANWERVGEEWAVLEWLSGGEKPEATREEPEITHEEPHTTLENPETKLADPETTLEDAETTLEDPETTREGPGGGSRLALPSDTWKTAEELSNQPAHAHWQRLRFSAIERVASACRNGVACKANRAKYAAGRQNIAVGASLIHGSEHLPARIYKERVELLFDDDTVWIARLTTNPDPMYNLNPETIADFMRIEVATLRLVSEKTIIPVPKVFAYSPTRENPVGWPYILMSALEGYRLENLGVGPQVFQRPIPEEKLPLIERFCASLAEMIVQLRWIKFPTTGSIYLDSNGEYAVREDVERCATSEEYWRMHLACSHMKADPKSHPAREFGLWLLGMAAGRHMEREDGPFCLAHRNLAMDNILVDKSGKITGIFGWTTAACLPRDFYAIQGLPFMELSRLEARYPLQETVFKTFSSALEEVAPKLARRYGSESIQVLARVIGGSQSLESLAAPGFWNCMCMDVWKRPNWRSVQEQRPVLQWLFGGEKPKAV